MLHKKRGLSGVVVTLLMITLSIAAIIIVWAVIRNVIQSGSEDINLGQYTIDLEVQKVVQSTNSADITVKRNPGHGTLTGLVFVVSDGINKQTFKQENIVLSELETKTFTIPYSSLIKAVEIAPIVSVQGENSAQNPVEEFEIPAENAVKNMPGLVSWYRFEGNANDEMGRNNGIVDPWTCGNTNPIGGLFGQAYELKCTSGVDIELGAGSSLQLQDSNFTVLSWTYLYAPNALKRPIIYVGNPTNPPGNYGLMIYRSSGTSNTRLLYAGTNKSSVVGNINFTTLQNKWIHVAASQAYNVGGNTITKVYVNGSLDNQATDTAESSLGGTVYLGGYSINAYLSARLDELMIFNRTLSDAEVKAIYELDLS
jgi:hypothetical protein